VIVITNGIVKLIYYVMNLKNHYINNDLLIIYYKIKQRDRF